MFLKPIHHRGRGRKRTYWALVESYRTARGSRHRVVAYLGDLKRGEKSGRDQLTGKLNGQAPPQPLLFDNDPGEPTEELVLVRLKGMRLQRTRRFGDVYLGLMLWRLLGLDSVLEQLLPPGREDVAWGLVAAALCIARLCCPGSERHIHESWYRATVLDDLLGLSVERMTLDRLYAGLDRLLGHKEAIEKHLKERTGLLFDLKYELLLYDLTSTYFEGQCPHNPVARRGYSRDHRGDCLQVVIALIVTEEGFPVGYEVFEGNRSDSKSVQEMVLAVEQKHGRAQRVWVMDRGCVSEANLAFLREHGGQYIVGTPKAMLRRFEKHLSEGNWQAVQEGVQVKLVEGPDGQEKFILARSQDRIEKEKAIHRRFVERMEAGLAKLSAAAESGRLKTVGEAQRRLGRLQQANSRGAGAFVVSIREMNGQGGKAKVAIEWRKEQRWEEWAALSEGCYLLRTNLADVTPQVLWKRYIQLTDAEWAFRINKDELEIRPVFHQKEHRVKAHILVCYVAYVMWKTLGGWMNRSGLGDAPRTVLEELGKIVSGDVVLPTSRPNGTVGPILRVRCVSVPEEHPRVLLERLGLKLPERLRTIEETEEALLAVTGRM
jgi:transposase